MSDKPFPPSARRRSLARHAGLTAASPVLVAGAAATAVAIALGVATAGAAVGDAIAAACTFEGASAADGGHAVTRAGVAMARAPHGVFSTAAPVLAAAALAALVAHLAQTRALWLPRRRIERAPTLDRGAGARARGAAFDLAAAAVVGGAAFAWLWLLAPRIARLVELEPRALLVASGAVGVSVLATIAGAWIAIGALDALARHRALGHALAMTAREKREDDRLASADPRWARERALAAGDANYQGQALSNAVAACAVVILGDDLAIAIAWDATRRPIPTRVAVGRRARATQLVGLARRHRVAVHGDAGLARALGDGEGPVPDARWRDLADVLVAVRSARV